MQHRLAAVHVLDESLDAAGERERLALSVTLVDQLDLHTVVEEGELANAPRQDLVVKLHIGERYGRGLEMHFGAASFRRSDHGKWRDRNAIMEVHLIHPAAAPDPELEPLGQAVYHGDTDAVQAAGDLVRILVELAPGMELGHHDLGRRALELVVVLDVGRNAAAVVDHRHGIVGVDDHLDVIAVSGQRFVDGVVEHLEHHVMKACAIGGVADVHSGALAHRLEALQDFDAVRVVAAIVHGPRLGFVHSQ